MPVLYYEEGRTGVKHPGLWTHMDLSASILTSSQRHHSCTQKASMNMGHVVSNGMGMGSPFLSRSHGFRCPPLRLGDMFPLSSLIQQDRALALK